MVRAANEKSTTFFIGCILWIIICIWLILSDFGVVAFFGSVLLGIWNFGLREKFSNEETASAYSVFNQDGKAIAGSYTAKHLEQQFRGGSGGSGSGEHGEDKKDNFLQGSVPTAKRNNDTSSFQQNMNDQERLRRRQAAAAAAEKRYSQASKTT